MGIVLPSFKSDNDILNRASRIATGDIAGNCLPFCDGLLKEEKICIMAGLDYNTPWTRDASINSMNYFSVAYPEIARNTLLSVCEEVNGKKRTGGQYWDAIIWSVAAYQHYLVNRDIEFLKLSFEIVKNSIERFEEEEFDSQIGLFRGPAVYGDGIAAYPDRYVDTVNHFTDIMAFVNAKPKLKAKKGFGIPMFALSTNCVYYAAYLILCKMGEILNIKTDDYLQKAQAVKKSVNTYFWNEKTGLYNYLYDDFGGCDRQEAIGLSFAILFGIADERQKKSIIENAGITQQGIACLSPSYERYRIGNNYGRHSGTVWPHAQGFWALAMLKSHNLPKFDFELFALAYKAVRDMQFAEIYHPVTGEIYGGMQENLNNGITLWKSCEKQTWSATAFWSLIFYGIIGLDFKNDGVEIKPNLPTGMSYAEIRNLVLFGENVNIIVSKKSDYPKSVKLKPNEIESKTYFLSV